MRWTCVGIATWVMASALAPQPAEVPVQLRFEAVLDQKPFFCGTTHLGVGSTRSAVDLVDLRAYFSRFRLVRRDGGESPIALTQDDIWQTGDVALLDFEDRTGACTNGTAATRTVVEGSVPEGEYTGLRFEVGVPFDKNHVDPTLQKSPLNLSRLFWSWNQGHKFMRLDFRTTEHPQGWMFHLGSTDCSPPRNRTPELCRFGNRVAVELPAFRPGSDLVVFDIATLLAGSDLDAPTIDTSVGCMSGQHDPDCLPLFERLGLTWNGRRPGPQRVFRVRPGAEAAPAQPAQSRTSEAAHKTRYPWDLPPGFPEPRVPEDNPMTIGKVALGRHLFYDMRLSVDGTFSCATCHQQRLAFTDGKARAVGVTGEVHPRGSMALANVAYSPVLTWANPLQLRLETQALVPMFGEEPVELGLSGHEAEMLARLAAEPRYGRLFADAFPGETQPITLGNVTRAIASFERTLLSGRSPYDRFRNGDGTAISESAKRGEALFFSERTECFHCHGGFNFTGTVDHLGKALGEVEFHNTGLYNLDPRGAYPAANTGVFAVTGNPDDMGRFRAPSLRNIAVTAPYMHDGSLATLDAVISHYEAGGRTIANGPNRGIGANNPRKSRFVKGFTLTPRERGDLKAFLMSLTDRGFTTDPRFSNPWSQKAPAGAGPAR